MDLIHQINTGDEVKNTHMPFLTIDENGEYVLFFCSGRIDEADSKTFKRLWKLWCITGSRMWQIETGLPDNITECSPTAWYDGENWNISFIAGDEILGHRSQLYQMKGKTLDTLGLAISIEFTDCGFVAKSRRVHGSVLNLIHIYDRNQGKFDLELPGAWIGRISYQADKLDRILIGGQWQMERYSFTLEYDLFSGKQSFLLCDNKPAYKPTIYGGTVLHVRCNGRYPDDRQIKVAKVFHRQSFTGIRKREPGIIPISVHTIPGTRGSCTSCFGTVDMGPVIRSSCLECVEKHLGATYVLLAEERDGYAHRLRAIGHLHEAEDESQAWKTLHNEIRKARKAFQESESSPDWKIFEELIQSIRNEISKDKIDE